MTSVRAIAKELHERGALSRRALSNYYRIRY